MAHNIVNLSLNIPTMSKHQISVEQELVAIKNILQQLPGGTSIETIQSAFGARASVRTLQRRLAELQKQGVVTVSGQKRSTLYHLAQPADTSPVEKTGVVLPLSAESKAIRKKLGQPVGNRIPVGYNINFLTSYRPNTDSYLTAVEKAKLQDLGKTARLDQPAGTYAREILQRLLIDLSWNSSRLEGNTYSLLDTQRLLSQGKAADNKTAAEAQMILNHKDAIEFIVDAANEIGFNRYTITNLHAFLSNNLLPDPAASGRLRTFGVGITHSVYTPLGIPQQIEEMFDLMLQKADQIENPFEQAFFIMVQLPYLQPFDDVNKRVSRLAANIPLNKLNLAPLAFVDVPDDLYIQGLLGVYELNRVELLKDVFIWAYERSALRYSTIRQSLGEPDAFRLQYREEMRALIAVIIMHAMSPGQANETIKTYAERLAQEDRAKFSEVVQTELLSLHDGNFARYRIRPSQFDAWKKAWAMNKQ